MSSSGHAGRPSSWVAVTVIFVGFLVGGIGLPFGNWILFWAGAAIVVVGGVIALLVDVMSDVVIAQPYASASPKPQAKQHQ
jgi:hypothetical protein